MKTNNCYSLITAPLLISVSILFSGCLKDKCLSTSTFKIYKPIYLSYEDLRSSVAAKPALDITNAGRIYYKAPYIFISEVDKGIHVIDNSNPSSPVNLSFINIPGNLDMAIKDNILYADSYIDLVAIDISDPMNVKEVDREQNVFPERVYNQGWTGDDSKGVIVDWTEGDTTVTYDCNGYPNYYGCYAFGNSFNGGVMLSSSTGGGTPQSGSVTAPGIGVAGSLARFTITQDYLYCLSMAEMKLFNITTANAPVAGADVTMPWNIETIFPYNSYLFIGTTSGVSIYNNSNPSSPAFVSTFSHVTSCDPVVVQGNYAYSTLRSGTACQGFTNQLDIIDITNISNPTLKTTYSMNNPYGLGIDGNNLFICDGAAGLKYYKTTDPLTLTLQTTVPLGETRDVIPVGGLLLVVTTTGFSEFDYSNGSLSQVGSFTY